MGVGEGSALDSIRLILAEEGLEKAASASESVHQRVVITYVVVHVRLIAPGSLAHLAGGLATPAASREATVAYTCFFQQKWYILPRADPKRVSREAWRSRQGGSSTGLRVLSTSPTPILPRSVLVSSKRTISRCRSGIPEPLPVSNLKTSPEVQGPEGLSPLLRIEF